MAGVALSDALAARRAQVHGMPRAALIDLDGVLYEGDGAVPGAADAIAASSCPRRLPHP